jgi:hypothetical protein
MDKNDELFKGIRPFADLMSDVYHNSARKKDRHDKST